MQNFSSFGFATFINLKLIFTLLQAHVIKTKMLLFVMNICCLWEFDQAFFWSLRAVPTWLNCWFQCLSILLGLPIRQKGWILFGPVNIVAFCFRSLRPMATCYLCYLTLQHKYGRGDRLPNVELDLGFVWSKNLCAD